MASTPTTADAELIVKLYDLRREPELRKARNWWLGFWPESTDDILKIATGWEPRKMPGFAKPADTGKWRFVRVARNVKSRTVSRAQFFPARCLSFSARLSPS